MSDFTDEDVTAVQTYVDLSDYAHVLQEIVPAAELHSTGYGLEVNCYLRVGIQATRAVNEQHATEMMRAYGEQIRARAIRTFGIQPILDGHRAEVEHVNAKNRLLSSRLADLQGQLDTANAHLAAIENGADDE